MIFSPLRYPGGKGKLLPFFKELLTVNHLIGCDYCEPYGGGAGLALLLLSTGFVASIRINDVDPAIYAFWIAALRNTDKFCKLLDRTTITINEWHRQQEIWRSGNLRDPVSLGFATYFLNRTNRSGIIEGAGPIGGYAQEGAWKIDVRLVKEKQIDNIRAISRFSAQIAISNDDAMRIIHSNLRQKNTLTYLDPPYFTKGRKLYRNYYEPKDHFRIARALQKKRTAKWVVSYDNVYEIREAYSTFSPITYSLNYSAGPRSIGTEVIFLSDAITSPSMVGFRVAA